MNALLSERGESVSGVSKEADLTDAESAPAVGTNTMLRRIREGEPLEAGGGLAPILGISAEGVAIEEVGDADDEYAITDIRSMYASDSTQVKRHHVVCVRTHTSHYTLINVCINTWASAQGRKAHTHTRTWTIPVLTKICDVCCKM